MKSGSLFSGIGGLDRGAEDAGIETAWQVEIDAQCRTLLTAKFPNATHYVDVRDIGFGKVEPVDLLHGGFPCQDLSVAGKRAGLAGERSGLWFEFRRIAEELRPAWLLIENVPGLYSSWSPIEPPPNPPGMEGGLEGPWDVDEDSDFAVVIEGLVELGYGVAWRCFDAQYFGVAQRRRRVFIVGCLGNAARAAQILFESESCSGDPPPRRQKRQGVAGTLGGGTGERGADTERMTFVPDVSLALNGLNDPQAADQATYVPEISKARGASPTATGHLDPSIETFVTAPAEFADSAFVAAPLSAGSHPNSNAAGRHREDDENLIAALTTESGYKGDAVTHALSSEGADASEDGTGRGTPIVAFAQNSRSEVRLIGGEGDHVGAVAAEPGAQQQTYLAAAVAFTERTRKEGRNFEAQDELAYALTNPGSGGRTHSRQIAQPLRSNPHNNSDPGMEARMHIQTEMAVRRLTPTECERLQGFPDGWTKGFSDSVRYRMLGNAVCVPVAAWIMRRIAAMGVPDEYGPSGRLA